MRHAVNLQGTRLEGGVLEGFLVKASVLCGVRRVCASAAWYHKKSFLTPEGDLLVQ